MSKAPSAFDLLKSGGIKRSRPSQGIEKESDAPRKKQEKAHGSSFQPCPVCRKAIASALLAFHVNSCLEASLNGSKGVQYPAQQQLHPEEHVTATAEADGTKRPSNPAQPSSGASASHAAIRPLDTKAAAGGALVSHLGSVRNGEHGSIRELAETNSLPPEDEHSRTSKAQAASTAAGHSGRSQQTHQAVGTPTTHQQAESPLSEEGVHRQQSRTQHASQERLTQLGPEGQQDSIPLHTAAKAQQSAVQQGQAKPEEAQPKAAQPSIASKSNAFAHMMQKQKEQSQAWTFYLGRAEDGRIFWHMWRDVKGSAAVPEIITLCSGHEVVIKAPDQVTVQRCKQQVVWSAESQANLADLKCRVDESVDRAAAGKVTLRLCTNIEPRHGGRLDVGSLLWKSGTAGRPWEYTGTVSLLKSALQKNIRRGRAEEAVRCAQRLLQSEPGELLRRACVISVEDALLHPQLPLLAFLMAATAKGYTLGGTLASACLRIIHDLAVVPVQDRAPKDLVLDEAGASLIRSMLMRAAFGGLQGDIAMLRRFSLLWLARLSGLAGSVPSVSPKGNCAAHQASNTWPLYLAASFANARPPGLVVEWGSPGRLKPDDIPAAAVDFHISSIIEDLLKKPNILAAATAAAAASSNNPAGALKSAMWHFSGSCNHRSLFQGCAKDQEDTFRERLRLLKPLWEAAHHAAEDWAHHYIHARFRPA